MILMFSFPFVVFSSSENNNKSAQKRNGNWTAREDASRALSFLLFSVCRAKKKSSNNYIYLKRALETLSNSLSLSLFSSERKGSLFTRAKSIEIGIRIGANCEVLKEKNPKRDVAYYHPAAREHMICAPCVIALDITVYK